MERDKIALGLFLLLDYLCTKFKKLISLNKIGLHFGGFQLFNDVSLLISPKDKIGLVGRNGAGKSTLMKLMVGLETPNEGTISKPSDLTIGYLPQQLKLSDERTLWEETRLAFSEVLKLNSAIESLTEKLADTTVERSEEEFMELSQRLSDLTAKQQMLGQYSLEQKAEQILFGLGFERKDFDQPTATFSGGWRMRIELAKLLLREPDILLLDEPTNHLDINSIQWLENFLKNYSGAILLVSHDKAFLDNITKRTVEIVLGKVYDYAVPYSKFLQLRAERREQQQRAYENQQKMIKETEDFIERFRYKATKSVQVQSRIKQLEKLDRIEIDEVDTRGLKIRFASPPRSGKITVELENLHKSYDTKEVLAGVDLIVERGEKIALVGKNGEGKSTLIKCIVGDTEFTGKSELGHNVSVGYFAQNQAQLLDEELTVFETIEQIVDGGNQTQIQTILGAFLFSGDDVQKKVKVLSGGERSRLAMIQLLMKPYNFLILDEPTNHLDIPSKELLKEALANYEGTVLLVSHDRDFLNGLAEKVYEVAHKKVKEYIGGIYDYLEKKQLESLEQLNLTSQTTKTEVKTVSENKLAYKERKELSKQLRKAEKLATQYEEEISKLEEQLGGIEKKLANPSDEQDMHKLSTLYQSLQRQIEKNMELWEQSVEEVEALKEKLDL
ncbi:ATP-binding cassette subfamily F protein 3 [Balneicella halophila]|uniref:Probable ATP-binding protein YbiT n=1 Tax=Balneicella halophila TaxID=1537566 RepID=A0A7L4URE8_BALHA|nr:ATP-binding cassette subfamily F protein 3 [Balneicella halophila]